MNWRLSVLFFLWTTLTDSNRGTIIRMQQFWLTLIINTLKDWFCRLHLSSEITLIYWKSSLIFFLILLDLQVFLDIHHRPNLHPLLEEMIILWWLLLDTPWAKELSRYAFRISGSIKLFSWDYRNVSQCFMELFEKPFRNMFETRLKRKRIALSWKK